jgi:hypothetical protein
MIPQRAADQDHRAGPVPVGATGRAPSDVRGPPFQHPPSDMPGGLGGMADALHGLQVDLDRRRGLASARAVRRRSDGILPPARPCATEEGTEDARDPHVSSGQR